MNDTAEITLQSPFEEFFVERETDGSLTVFNADGDLIHNGLPPHWRAPDIMTALNIGKAAFGKGRLCGRAEKARQIREAINEDVLNPYS